MKDKVKNHILKYICKYISLVVAIVALPFFNIVSFAYQEADIALTGYSNAYFLCGTNDNRSLRFRFTDSDGSIIFNQVYDLNSTDNSYILSNEQMNDVRSFYIGTAESNFDIMWNFNLFDYYIYITCHTHDLADTFSPHNVRLRTYDTVGAGASMYNLEDLSVYYHNDASKKGFTVCGKVPNDILNTNISVIDIFSNPSVLGADYVFEGVVFAFDKGAESSSSAIVTAINNQTSSLGGKLDGIDNGIAQGNDLIENGTDETQQAVTDFNEVFEDFNTQLEEIESFETQFTEDWNAANETYLNEISQFTLPYGVINAGNWLSTSMQTIYDNSDDYKMLWLVPLLLGVPLVIFFFKRGDNSE